MRLPLSKTIKNPGRDVRACVFVLVNNTFYVLSSGARGSAVG